jgi:hypothetical protein
MALRRESMIREVGLLATSAFRVHHAATPALTADVNAELGSIRGWMTANNFDVVPVSGADRLSYLSIQAVCNSPAETRCYEVMEPVPRDRVVRENDPLRIALEALASKQWLMVGTNEECSHLLTRHDYSKPVVSVYLLALLMATEQGLRRLFGTYTNTPVRDSPQRGESELDTFGSLMDGLRGLRSLQEDLGYPSKNQFKRVLYKATQARNRLAHGGSVLDIEKHGSAGAEYVELIEDLSSKVLRVLNDRDQIWDAFEKTIIHLTGDPESRFTGPGAITLPSNDPLIFISAENPFERVLSTDENRRRTSLLQEQLSRYHPVHWKCIGKSFGNSWMQTCFLIQNINLEEASSIAAKYGQRSVFELHGDMLKVWDLDGNLKRQRSRTWDLKHSDME